MKNISLKINWLELVLALLLGSYFGYFILAVVTDMRLDEIRPYVTKQAVSEAIVEYEKKYLVDEGLIARKRKVRDQKLREYADKLNDVLDMKEDK